MTDISLPGGAPGEVPEDDMVAIRQAYAPLPDAKVEFNVHDNGLSILANAEGWRSLAEWCMVMAHPDLPSFVAPYELTREVFPAEMFAEGRAILSFWGIEGRPEFAYQDVFFHRGDDIGEAYWEGAVRTGNSPYTAPASFMALDRYKWIEHKMRSEVEERLGPPIFAREVGIMQKHRENRVTTACYRADTPEGWIGVEYDGDGEASWVGFGMVAPWDNPIPEQYVTVPFEGL